ncbi:maleylpyruvate isomerase family mycothiol-dependent enzyme [Paenarthrobacter sp. NPDC091669]|uniref:maleylpyruvate isomerase family mycothiol-dependent enzyme n=1 Tax=Paenarthrobacter sp. NPDC091669 TaxID=3364384 RepID=UPI0037F7DD93
MTNPARLHSDLSRLSRETDMFLATVASLSDAEMAAASRCEGWSRADVIAHVASSGRTLVNLIDGAVFGEERELHASHEARSKDVCALAALRGEELMEELRDSARNFAEQAQRLNAEVAAPDANVNGKIIPATSIVALRIAEVIVHHHDLDTAWTIEEADPDSLLNAIEAVVLSLRAKDAPGMTLVTEERDEWVIGDGALHVTSDREGMLRWLARGEAEQIEADGLLPALPAW